VALKLGELKSYICDHEANYRAGCDAVYSLLTFRRNALLCNHPWPKRKPSKRPRRCRQQTLHATCSYPQPLCFSETSANLYQIARHHIPENSKSWRWGSFPPSTSVPLPSIPPIAPFINHSPPGYDRRGHLVASVIVDSFPLHPKNKKVYIF
jgi:hypothetical protein